MSAREADDGEICVEFCLQGVQVPSSAGLTIAHMLNSELWHRPSQLCHMLENLYHSFAKK